MEDKIKAVNSALIKAMADMRENETNETRNVFIQELLNSKLIIPSVIKPEPVEGKIAPNSTISFFSVKTKDKERVLFLFTSVDELKKWQPAEGKHLILQNYNQFKDFVTGENAKYDGIVIDPYGLAITVKKGLIEKINSVVKPMKVVNEKISVDEEGLQPAEYASPGLYAALCDAMLRNEAVNAAWMMQVKKQGEKMPTTVLVVDTANGSDMKNTFNSLARVAREFFAENEGFGIMPAHDRAAMMYIKNVAPFYLKDKWGVESNLAK